MFGIGIGMSCIFLKRSALLSVKPKVSFSCITSNVGSQFLLAFDCYNVLSEWGPEKMFNEGNKCNNNALFDKRVISIVHGLRIGSSF